MVNNLSLYKRPVGGQKMYVGLGLRAYRLVTPLQNILAIEFSTGCSISPLRSVMINNKKIVSLSSICFFLCHESLRRAGVAAAAFLRCPDFSRVQRLVAPLEDTNNAPSPKRDGRPRAGRSGSMRASVAEATKIGGFWRKC